MPIDLKEHEINALRELKIRKERPERDTSVSVMTARKLKALGLVDSWHGHFAITEAGLESLYEAEIEQSAQELLKATPAVQKAARQYATVSQSSSGARVLERLDQLLLDEVNDGLIDIEPSMDSETIDRIEYQFGRPGEDRPLVGRFA